VQLKFNNKTGEAALIVIGIQQEAQAYKNQDFFEKLSVCLRCRLSFGKLCVCLRCKLSFGKLL